MICDESNDRVVSCDAIIWRDKERQPGHLMPRLPFFIIK